MIVGLFKKSSKWTICDRKIFL